MRIVIVGGVAGGMSAATRLRRLSEEDEIIILEKGAYELNPKNWREV